MNNRPVEEMDITVFVNGQRYQQRVPVRLTLGDFLRERLGLTGTHLGCEQGVCGTCTVMVDGKAVRSCLMLAVQCDGAQVYTVEGLAREGLHPLQEAFRTHHALQCGYCTPGVLMSAAAFLEEWAQRGGPEPTEEEIRRAMTGTLCRCTGYEGIVNAIAEVARSRAR